MNPAMEARLQIITLMMKTVGIIVGVAESAEKNPKFAAWTLVTIAMMVEHSKIAMAIIDHPDVIAPPAGRCIFY